VIWLWLYLGGILPAAVTLANLAAYDNKMPSRETSIYFKSFTHPALAAFLGVVWPTLICIELFSWSLKKVVRPGEMLAERKLHPRLPPAKPQPDPEDLAAAERAMLEGRGKGPTGI